MDLGEVVEEIVEAFHTSVSDDDYVNERSARASIYDLVEKYVDEIVREETYDESSEIRDLRQQVEDLEEEADALRTSLAKYISGVN